MPSYGEAINGGLSVYDAWLDAFFAAVTVNDTGNRDGAYAIVHERALSLQDQGYDTDEIKNSYWRLVVQTARAKLQLGYPHDA